MKRKSVNRRGQTIMMFTLAMVPLLGMIGLVVDIGWAYFRKEAAQTAADAAAGAASIAAYNAAGAGAPTCTTTGVSCYATEYICPATAPTTAANNIDVACMYASENGFTTTGRRKVTVQSGVGTAPTATASVNYWVVVRVSEQVPQLFSRVLGVDNANITARADHGLPSQQFGRLHHRNEPHCIGRHQHEWNHKCDHRMRGLR
jgi:Flp pilus assembly protein TadG